MNKKHKTMLSAGTSTICGFKLLSVGYFNYISPLDHWPKGEEGYAMVALRTLTGNGRVTINVDGATSIIDLPANSLFLLDDQYALRYEAWGDENWSGWWIEFMADQMESIPLHQVLSIKTLYNENRELERIFKDIGNNSFWKRQSATSGFVNLLHSWMATSELTDTCHPEYGLVEYAIARMKDDLSDCIGIKTLANEVNLTALRFRDLFVDATGLTPKKYYDRLRMDTAMHMLHQGQAVSKVAQALGFSDQFHFSKKFVKYFQVTPSKIKLLKKCLINVN